MSHAVGVDLGGTKTAFALVSEDGVLGDVVTAPTPAAKGGSAVLDVVADRLLRGSPLRRMRKTVNVLHRREPGQRTFGRRRDRRPFRRQGRLHRRPRGGPDPLRR